MAKKEITVDGYTYILKEEEPKPEYKEGDWVVGLGGQGRVNTIYSTGKVSVIDFNKDISIYRNDQVILMSSSEIESHLIAEAKKRGYEDYVLVDDCKYGGKERLIPTNALWCYFEKEDYLTRYGKVVYSRGEWSKIIKEEPLKIAGYEVEFKNGAVKVGCKGFTNDFAKTLHNISTLCKNNSLELSVYRCGNVIFDDKENHEFIHYDQLHKIVEKLKD